MKYLRLFENFEDIDSICKKYGIENYTINKDGSIDVDGNVDLNNLYLRKFPLEFRNVSGKFDCRSNYFVSLKGGPERVGSDFSCGFNDLSSLEFCPKYVGGHFNCYSNGIISFEYLPETIGGILWCGKNPIYELWELFEDYSKIELFNDYDIVRGDGIVLDRLNSFLQDIGEPTVEKVEGYNNI